MRRALALFLMTAAAACSSSSGSSSCNVAYDCGSGETCASTDGRTWECVRSGPGKWGDACDASGSITCGDRLGCVSLDDPTSGTCDWLCDETHPCPAGICAGGVNPEGSVVHYCAGGPCSDAYDCAAGQTCTTTDGITYQCVTSGSGKAGDACAATPGAPLVCGDHLTCLAHGDPTNGACTRWCGPDDPCPPSQTCQAVATTSGPVDHLCQ